jgi:surfactin synthase thioesterase subunit
VCVPYAGGGVPAFRGWPERLPNVDVGIVQLPGRAGRLRDPLITVVADAAAEVADALSRLPACPTILFGHSLGALIAFEAARQLSTSGAAPLALFVSGRRGPALPNVSPPIADLPTPEFLDQVRLRYGALPDAVLADPDLVRILVPGLRADFAMLESYRYEPGVPLDCPIVACAGSADPHATRPELEAWRPETRRRFAVRTFTGGHFYLQDEREALIGFVAGQLTVLLCAAARLTVSPR